MTNPIRWNDQSFLREVEKRSHTRVSACFQCHKCSTGCPVGQDMEVMSSQIMRLIHLGADQEVLESNAIWLCASCEACTTRCPMGIDIAAVMDALRIMAVERNVQIPNQKSRKFGSAMLGSVRRHGRVFELETVFNYKMATLDLFSDMDKAAKLFAKGKLSFLPNRSGSVKQVRKIFERTKREEGKQ